MVESVRTLCQHMPGNAQVGKWQKKESYGFVHDWFQCLQMTTKFDSNVNTITSKFVSLNEKKRTWPWMTLFVCLEFQTSLSNVESLFEYTCRGEISLERSSIEFDKNIIFRLKHYPNVKHELNRNENFFSLLF